MMLILFQLCSCYNFGPDVMTLTANNFQKEVEKRDNKTVYFVMFHGTHCPACQMSYPEFDAAARESSEMIKFGEVNTNQQYTLGSQFRITAIPTFIVFHPKGQTTYMRDRSARSMLNFAASLIPDLTHKVDEEWLPSDDETKKEIILLSNKLKAPPLWNGISCAYDKNKKGIKVGFTNNKTLQSEFGVNALPTILMIDGNKSIVYEGKNNFGLIRKAVDNFFNGIMPSPKPSKPTPTPIVINALNSSDEFDKYCKGKSVFCVLEGSENTTSLFKSAAKKYRHDPFKFYTCGKECPFEFAKKNTWIFHHKRNSVVKIEDVAELGTNLDRVLDGGAKFEPIEKFTQNKEL